jgi:hypothetical protein
MLKDYIGHGSPILIMYLTLKYHSTVNFISKEGLIVNTIN